jgi:hypothetical protein
MGEDDGIDGFGIEIETAVDGFGQGTGALEQATVEEDAFAGDVDFVQRAGDGLGGAVEDYSHLIPHFKKQPQRHRGTEDAQRKIDYTVSVNTSVSLCLCGCSLFFKIPGGD